MKLHRHVVHAGGRDYTVITLRPGTYARFSDNSYHGTWHFLSDLHGARVLGRLLWDLAYQRVPGTLVLNDGPHLDPSPFSGERADPIALVPASLTHLPERAARELQARLPLKREVRRPWQVAPRDMEPLIWQRAASIRSRSVPRSRRPRFRTRSGLRLPMEPPSALSAPKV
jgi:hypothetical protein